MFLRLLLLFILLLSNQTATSVSACVFDDCYANTTADTKVPVLKSFLENSTEETSSECSKPNCCRKNHLPQSILVQYMVIPPILSNNLYFPDPVNSFANNVLEIIKPPLT